MLYVPDFGTNFVSATALMSKRLSILLAELTCQIYQYNNMTLAKGKRTGGLIHLSITVPSLQVKEEVVHLTKVETNAKGSSA